MTHVGKRITQWITAFDLKTRMLLFAMIPINLILLGVFLSGLYLIHTSTEKVLQEDLELIGRTIQFRVEDSLRSGDIEQLNETMEAAFQFRRVYGISVYDSFGNLVWQLGSNPSLPTRSKIRTLVKEGSRGGEYEEERHPDVYSFFLPLTAPTHQNLGLLHLTRKREEIHSVLVSVRKRMVWFIIIALILSSAIILVADRFIIQKPVNILKQAMAHAARGNLKTRVHLSSPPELSSIGNSLNEMLSRLERANLETKKEKTAKDMLKKELKKAEHLALFGQFAAGIAHDLGTPLSVIDGMAQQTLRRIRKGKITEETRNIFEDIAEESTKMDHILRQLLDFARGNSTQKRKVDLDEVVKRCLTTMKPIAEKYLVELKVEVQHSPDDKYVVNGDPVQLHQVLMNLLKNALEAAKRTVVLSLQNKDGKILIAVDDDGPGIQTESSDKIFEPFFTTKKRGFGSGLGLAVVHGIVAEHDGRVQAFHSTLGGARFEVSLKNDPSFNNKGEPHV